MALGPNLSCYRIKLLLLTIGLTTASAITPINLLNFPQTTVLFNSAVTSEILIDHAYPPACPVMLPCGLLSPVIVSFWETRGLTYILLTLAAGCRS